MGATFHFSDSLDVFSFNAVDKKRALKKEEWPTTGNKSDPNKYFVKVHLMAGNVEIQNCDGCASWKRRGNRFWFSHQLENVVFSSKRTLFSYSFFAAVQSFILVISSSDWFFLSPLVLEIRPFLKKLISIERRWFLLEKERILHLWNLIQRFLLWLRAL